MKSLITLTLAAAAWMAATATARAECAPDAAAAEVTKCLADDLRASDKRINAVYKLLMENKDEAGKLALRDEQRAWLKARDKTCQLDNKETDREKWLQTILSDQGKTLCVVRRTFDRVAQLDAMLKQVAPSTTPPVPAAPQAPSLTPAAQVAPGALDSSWTFLDDGYAADYKQRHESGKWYLEIKIDRAGIAALGDSLLTTQISNGHGGVMQMINIRRSHTGASPLALGIAVDLDNGFIYWRERGTWAGQPGSINGNSIKLGRAYWPRLEGSAEVRELMRRNLITVNLGTQPFEYALPDGYRPFAEQ